MTTLVQREPKKVPTPERPWRPSFAQRLSNFGVAIAAVLLTYILVLVTPMKGLLPTLIFSGIFAIVLGYLKGFFARGTMAGRNNAVGVFLSLGMVIALIPIVSILYAVVSNGYKGLHKGLLFQDMSLAVATDPIAQGGLKHAIVGTFIMVAVALAISLPLGILTAVYLTEIKGPLSKPIRFLVQAMSGVPSIVAGLFILSAVVYTVTKSYSGLMGSLALTILMIPTIARTSEEVLLLIPNDLREAGVALGGTQWRTVAMVVVPAARSGLVTAMILGIARVAGETAPILLLTGGADMTNYNPFSGPMGTLPFYIWKSFFFGSPEAVTRGWAGLLVLLILVLLLFFLARSLSTRKASR